MAKRKGKLRGRWFKSLRATCWLRHKWYKCSEPLFRVWGRMAIAPGVDGPIQLSGYIEQCARCPKQRAFIVSAIGQRQRVSPPYFRKVFEESRVVAETPVQEQANG